VIASPFSDGSTIIADPNLNSVFWCGGSFQFALAVCRITGGGASWNRTILSTVGDCAAIAIAPSNSQFVYAGGKSSSGQPWLFKTTDGGASWDTLTALSFDTTLKALAVDPVNPNIVYAGKGNGVFRSSDGGISWASTGLADVRAIAIDPDQPQTVYAGTANGAYVSPTGGGGWTAMNDGLDYPAVTDLKVGTDHYLYSSTNGTGMYRWRINAGISEHSISGGTRILSAYPNPMRGHVTFNITRSFPGNIETRNEGLRIYDVNGRLIKTLPLPLESGKAVSSITWNGDDETGNPLPAGVYFYRLAPGDPKNLRTMIIIK
jgi:FlgD Ig-like domain